MRLSLRLKFVALAVGLVLVAGGGLSLYTLLAVRERLLAEFQQRCRRLVEAAARDLAGDLAIYNVRDLRRKLAALRADPAVTATYVLDTEGRVVTDGTRANLLRDRPPPREARLAALAHDLRAVWQGELLYVDGPVFLPDATHVGFLEVTFSAARVRAIAARIFREAGLLTLLALVLGAAGAAGAAHHLSRPIQTVAAAARAVGKGHFDVTLPQGRRDEVGELAHAVAQMAHHRRAAEEALRAARDAALESARMKSRFLANMSHEIRTPMNGVLGMADLLLDSNLTPEQREYCQTIRGCGEALLQILNDVLDLSKIEAGMLEVDRKPFDYLPATEAVVRLLAERAVKGAVELAVDMGPDLPAQVIGDEGRYRQILTNLVGNALKFTEKGHVIVRLQRVGSFLRVAVEDTGIGIPSEAQSRVFAPFAQVGGSEGRKYGGTGLGLSIARELTERMGGQIGLESSPGRGSTFWFTLSAADGPARRIEPVAAGRTAVCGYRYGPVREILVRLLQALGCRVVAQGDETLLQAGAALQADLVFLEDALFRAAGEGALPRGRLVLIRPRHGGAVPVPENTAVLSRPVLPSGVERVVREALGLAARHPEAARPPRQPGALSGARVLVAEDNRVNQTVIRKLLQRLGCSPVVVPHGRKALEMLQKESFDLVLMDCEMPEMDGLTAAREIRRLVEGGQLKPVPVIALTAHAMKGDATRCREAGMDDYLTKPLQPDRLEATLRRWLAPARATQSERENP